MNRHVTGLLVVLLAALSVSLPEGASGEREQEAIQGRQAELEDLKGRIESNRSKIGKLREREKDLSKLRESLVKDRRLTGMYLQQLNQQERALRKDLAERQEELLQKEVEAEETTIRLKKRLLRYYKLRHVSGGELIFSSLSFNELFARGQFLARLIHQDRLDLGALSQERDEIAQATSILDSRRRGVDTLQKEKRREENRLRQQGEEAQAALAGVQDERETHEARLRELERSQTAIRQMIARLERARQEEGRRSGAFQGEFAKGKGQLYWPVDGRIIAKFGVEIHPKYKTEVPMNGIAIAAPEGTPILAVAPGVVEFVDWYAGYGRTVILNHGSGFYTLYAHASAVMVERGMRVEQGQEIARVGDTDSIRGSCLHFEIRLGEEALDPMDWLR